jgi:hypothetical protein
MNREALRAQLAGQARLDEPGSSFQSPECESSGLPMT